MPRSSSPRRPIVVGLLLIGAAVGLLIADHASTGRGPVSVTLGALVGPLHRAISAAGHDTRALWSHYVALSEVHEDNAALRARIGELEERAASVDGLRAENQRLRALLDLADTRKDLRLRSARVVGRSVSDFFRVLKLTLEVDPQGEDAGDTRGGAELVVGMPVIAPGGVVGQLRSVDGDRAEVLMLTDPRASSICSATRRPRSTSASSPRAMTVAIRRAWWLAASPRSSRSHTASFRTPRSSPSWTCLHSRRSTSSSVRAASRPMAASCSGKRRLRARPR